VWLGASATLRRATAGLAALALGAAACTGSDPPPPPLAIPDADAFDRLLARAPAAAIQPPLTLDAQSCAFARYSPELTEVLPQPFVLIHPLRTQCELWLGRTGFVLEYCLFPRDQLVEIDTSLRLVYRVNDADHCTFGADPPPEP
jgi:hypothetical protein